MGSVGDIYLNFALWAIALFPAWLVVKEIGVTKGDLKIERERALANAEQFGNQDD
jgi:hypothetical protein